MKLLEEQQLAFGARLPGRADERDENAEAAAVERAADSLLCDAGFQHAQAFGSAQAVGLAGQRGAKAGEMDAVLTIKIRSQHGAVKRGQADFVEQTQLDSGQIAVSKKRLGMGGDGFGAQTFEQIIRSVAAAQGHDGADGGIEKCGVKIGKALQRGSSEVERFADKGVGGEFGRKSQRAQRCEAEIDALRLGERCGRDNADARARRDGPRFHQARHFTTPPRER